MDANKGLFIGIALAVSLGSSVRVSAGEVDIPNTFQSGTNASAADVNQNFGAIESAIDDNAQLIVTLTAQIESLEATVAALQASLDQVSNNSVLQLDGLLALDSTDVLRPAAVFTGVNVQIVNGLGIPNGTTGRNGVGNLLVGYDRPRTTSRSECSDGRYTNQIECETQGAIWAINHKTGSHNIVVGPFHNYSHTASIVSGAGNTSSFFFTAAIGSSAGVAGAQGAIVLGGALNEARNEFAVVVGGQENVANGRTSTVTGGWNNVASGSLSSVNGGGENTAVGEKSTVGGGALRTATGNDSWVAGSLSESN